MGIGRGAGKAILVGEHAVVYGKPALAVGLGLGTEVRAQRAEALSISCGPLPESDRKRLLDAAGRVCDGGWALTIHSDLPVGRGMGSSAALAVAVVRAIAAAEGTTLSLDQVYDQAMEMERVFHGTPSGLDVAIASQGGVLRFTKGPPPAWSPLPPLKGDLVILDTGIAGNTAELVAGVRERLPQVGSVIDEIGVLVEQAQSALQHPETLGPLLFHNHTLLQQLGVSTPQLDAFVELSRREGALGAKLSGAGGGGIVIALTRAPERLVRAATASNIRAFHCTPTSGVSS